MEKSCWRTNILALAVCWLAAYYPSQPVAATNPARMCDHAAREAALATGVPQTVLRAITRVETGRMSGGHVQPWPWTVNMEGAGRWFDNEDAARKYVFSHFKRGARSFDVGCFQVNYRWHSAGFASIDEMFDPMANALYAARFLKSLHEEFGDWPTAVGAYHSRSPEFARRYTARFERIFKTIASATSPDIPSPSPESGPSNSFPLLVAGRTNARLGSLVPLDHAERRGSLLPQFGG